MSSILQIKMVVDNSLVISALAIVLLFGGWQVQAQTDISERLLKIEEQIAAGNLPDSVIFQKYDTLIYYYGQRDIEKFRLYYPKAISLAREKKNEMWEAIYLRKTAANLFFLSETDSLLIFLDRALKLIEDKDNWVEESSNFGWCCKKHAAFSTHIQN
jgi:hypothetical protein